MVSRLRGSGDHRLDCVPTWTGCLALRAPLCVLGATHGCVAAMSKTLAERVAEALGWHPTMRCKHCNAGPAVLALVREVLGECAAIVEEHGYDSGGNVHPSSKLAERIRRLGE